MILTCLRRRAPTIEENLYILSVFLNVLLTKGPSKNVNVFTSVQNIHFQGGGLKINIFPYTFNFLAWFFIIFMRIFGTQKMLMCTLWGRGRGSQKVYGLYTRENVDIYGWPLTYEEFEILLLFHLTWKLLIRKIILQSY